ncbi:unnamed protein product [Pocillopora meandrina]|uniref:Autophagy-related protein 27 n=1 Tax=Pocillopora meandrina TaxID=46732 RepID=A0AAU9Y5U7_9CNID|nr:unnamed protein product [Pocillopora meandrina]
MAGCKLLRYVCLFLLGYVGAVTATCKKRDDCSCRMSDGKVLDLKPLDKNPGPSFTGMKDTDDKPNVYSWNPCTKFKEPDTNCEDALLCQETPSKDSYTVAKEVSSFDENSDGSINITYTPCTVPSQKDFIREAIIVLMCDHTEDRGKFSQFLEHKIIPDKKSLYTATFSTKYACFESGGLSTGSILLIVFFPLVLIYFIAGLLYNKIHKGVSSFPEMIPNHSFWGDVPFLVKDGCVFTFQGIAGCCKRVSMKVKGDSYAEI